MGSIIRNMDGRHQQNNPTECQEGHQRKFSKRLRFTQLGRTEYEKLYNG